MGTRNMDEEYGPPTYSVDLPPGEQTLETLETMELDSSPNVYPQLGNEQSTWDLRGFSTLPSIVTHDTNDSNDGDACHGPMTSQAHAGSEEEMEGDELFDGASNKANSSMGGSDNGMDDRSFDFPDLPPPRFGTPVSVSDMQGQDSGDELVPALLSSPDPLIRSGLTSKGRPSYEMDMGQDEPTAEIRLDDSENESRSSGAEL